jgi:flavin reductase (DIM6/NTAB) family NADH-FMN oxidoreductase RutF
MKTVTGTELRHAMRRLPSPVTIVTASVGEKIRGITIGSFASVSLEPALVSLNLSVETPMLPLVERSSRFVVHVLREDQAHLSELFAVPDRTGEEQFAEVAFHRDETGLPVLEGVLARLYCSVDALHPAGDHVLVIGRVDQVEELSAGHPLVYFNRGYHSVGDEVDIEVVSGARRASTGTS